MSREIFDQFTFTLLDMTCPFRGMSKFQVISNVTNTLDYLTRVSFTSDTVGSNSTPPNLTLTWSIPISDDF
jgi:hypothetical protein